MKRTKSPALRCDRKELWESLANISNNIDDPWCIEGDFNVIKDTSEKLGGRQHRTYKSIYFISCMDQCGMTDMGFVGSRYTWCNNMDLRHRIWKRLDRILVNDSWEQQFQNIKMKHLGRTGSDHRPLLMRCNNDNTNVTKYFRFLNF